ncbi:putative two-component histidine kinase [Gordonia effusa NBRC 100432]|uniref:Signal transduction histidine-protein kinase/phosphatase MprB n=1 Tax=Gordonia effusa NBRC 100432 TaxID=1077974 RepID=H0R6P1_9ACTN|nr:HAMP domain-containing sensor histidine kinase [Gordonia effusa]GAB20742.1 putative two-component histidine kinase [Gordonia effusa NBRC 100432]
MRHRILTSMIAMVAGVGVLLGAPLMVIAWWWVSDHAHQDLEDRLKRLSVLLIRDEIGPNDVAGIARTDPAFRLLVPEDGILVISRPTSGTRPGTTEVVVGDPPTGSLYTDRMDLGELGVLQLSVPLDSVRNDQWAAVGIVATIVVASVAATTVVAAVTASRLADPVIDLANRAGAMARGDFRSEWRTYGIAELDRLSAALDAANSEIADRWEREGEIVGEVSHQLRSRLTAIQLRLDELSMHADPDVVVEAEAAAAQVDRLSSDLDEMVAASRESSDVPSIPIEVAQLVTTLSKDFAHAYEAMGRQIVVRVAADATAWSSQPSRLREALSVLVDNALQHGAGTCTISAAGLVSAPMLRITVSDEGRGVPDELVTKIFRRGFTGGRGSGVGLALARALIEADGGRLDLVSRHPTVFAIVVPASGPEVTAVKRDRAPHR